MNESQQLENTIAALEAQRLVLGDAVVDTALAPLKEKLVSLQQQKVGEQRKLVSMLFADLSGFTRLSEQIDAKDMREILNRYFGLWSARIEQYGGVVEKFIGDAVMAVFGLAVARENDTENAIRAALDMRQALQDLNAALAQSHGLQLAMRVGIHAGPVVVSLLGERYKRSDGQDFTVVGDAVNLASRLQEIAPEGGILISHDAYRHVRGAFDVSAQPYFEAALRLFRLMGYRMREAIALNNLGVIAYEQGNYGEARRLHTQTLQINQEINDVYGIGSSFANLGDIDREEGRYADAQANYEQGLQLARQIGDRLLESLIIANLSLLYVQLGDHQAAIAEGWMALKLTQEMEVPLYEAYSATRLALALVEGGQLDEAAESYKRALELQRKLGLENNAVESQAGLARIALARGSPAEARQLVEEILLHLEKNNLDGVDEPARVYMTCYDVLQAHQDARALEILKAAFTLVHKRASRIDDPQARSSFLENVPVHRELAAIWEEHKDQLSEGELTK